MIKKLKIEDFEDKLGLWFDHFKPFLESEKGYNLYAKLRERRDRGNIILPPSKYTFNAFGQTNPNLIKAIIVSEIPYHKVNKIGIPYADGLAFSCRYAKELTPSLNAFYDALDSDFNKKHFRNEDLTYLADQEVLLLNSCLTTEVGKPSIHEDLGIWDDFNHFLYTEVLNTFFGIPIVFIGNKAEKFSKLLFPLGHVFKCIEHPNRALKEKRVWNHEKCFKWIEDTNFENNGPWDGIEWDYMKCKDIPF